MAVPFRGKRVQGAIVAFGVPSFGFVDLSLSKRWRQNGMLGIIGRAGDAPVREMGEFPQNSLRSAK